VKILMTSRLQNMCFWNPYLVGGCSPAGVNALRPTLGTPLVRKIPVQWTSGNLRRFPVWSKHDFISLR